MDNPQVQSIRAYVWLILSILFRIWFKYIWLFTADSSIGFITIDTHLIDLQCIHFSKLIGLGWRTKSKNQLITIFSP